MIRHIYTDGACSVNPGPGGWAYAIIDPVSDEIVHHDSGCVEKSTNNRMELQAVLEALSALEEPAYVELYTDSEYVCNGVSKWIYKWYKNDWKISRNKPLKNVDLWKEIYVFLKYHHVSPNWVRGHNGNEHNEFVDALAVEAYQPLLAHARVPY